jgi:alpha-tubulin suppressor-like RCC1 family protein
VTQLPPEKKIKEVVAGMEHSFILFDDDTLFACGSNYAGALGIGDNVMRTWFTSIPCLPMGKKIQHIVASYNYSFILYNDNTLYACGGNDWGQLGLGDTRDTYQFTAVTLLPAAKKIKQVVTGAVHSFILFDDGTLFACGNNSDGQLGMGDNVHLHQFTAVASSQVASPIQKLIAGLCHSLIILADGKLLACGNNSYDQLGFGARMNRNSFVEILNLPIENENEKKVKNVATGYSHSFIFFDDDTLFVCGQDDKMPFYKRTQPTLPHEPVDKFNHWVDLYEQKRQKVP